MKFFEQMGIERKYGAVFGLAAFILSLLTGLVSGVSFSVTIIRSLIMAPVFFIVGYGIITVLKKYVPEIYEALVSTGNKGGETGLEGETEVNLSGIEPAADADEYGESGKDKGEEFTELTQKDFDRYKTTEDSGLDAAFNASGGKMGKHIIVQEQFNSYEPKIMAQAIRTMMSKDKD
ncbi:MAG TPA: hypothetical protein P5120_02370 [Spirochaetota bacterium]|nr:hypothetical protein [Spirochaetota bacterium]HPF06018.1 hypothetical protein [Spirochaetota bacterium]HPJ41832.1 hypothetical protein [Spirochaetota bacterium]HPR36799.1 hypothetical protein [Spirochaetota bacterium]HRX46338.1 hypothetical protein [Spirochaetota bacterium]